MSPIRHRQIVRIIATVLLVGTVATARSQNISEIAKSDPLVISGAIGTNNTYRHSSGGNGFASPWSNTIYANLNISVYGISMPFSFYYTNNNTSFSYPQISFNISPTYKKWRGHLGQSSMDFSQYVMTSSFNGIGLEYTAEKFRAGAFYGTLHKAINDDPLDKFARAPQYKRIGWGMKVGYGSATNYIDLYFLRAYDKESSLDERWRNSIRPQDNLVVGLRGAVSPFRWLSFTANAAASILTSDTESQTLNVPDADKFSSVFETKYSTSARFAGDANINLFFKGISASLSYRYIQPDYKSLGLNYMSNNYHSLGINANTILFRKLSLSGSFSYQADNLTKQQLYTTKGYIYNVRASISPLRNLSMTFAYNGYTQKQTDGTIAVTDSTQVHRRMSSFSFAPTYSIEGEVLGHTIGASVNYTINKDLNKVSGYKNDIKTFAAGANYSLLVKPWETDFTLAWSEQKSEGYRTKYVSDLITLDVGRSFLKDNTLRVSAGANMTYNHILRESKSLSIGGQCSASYTVKKAHSFSFNASYYRYGDVNMAEREAKIDQYDLSVSLNYAYTFELLRIMSKAHKKELQEAKQQ